MHITLFLVQNNGRFHVRDTNEEENTFPIQKLEKFLPL